MSLQQRYKTEIIPQLQSQLGLRHASSVPRLEKVVVHVGVGKNFRDEKEVELVERTLLRITGQKPVRTRAKKSIAGFKLREGMVVGVLATLRGKRMYDFIEKLIRITLPRVRDFRGLEAKSIDAQGNVTLGLKEHIAFPEIRSDEVEKIHGVSVVITTTAKNREVAQKFFHALGFPFQK